VFATIAMSIRWRGSRPSLEFHISDGHVPRDLACIHSGMFVFCIQFTLHSPWLSFRAGEHATLYTELLGF
jgi:hypothetical protein